MLKLEPWRVSSARSDYYSIASGLRAICPDALKDPMIAAAVLQFEMAEMVINARLDQLAEDE